jgi:hypothetical protein
VNGRVRASSSKRTAKNEVFLSSPLQFSGYAPSTGSFSVQLTQNKDAKAVDAPVAAKHKKV